MSSVLITEEGVIEQLEKGERLEETEEISP